MCDCLLYHLNFSGWLPIGMMFAFMACHSPEKIFTEESKAFIASSQAGSGYYTEAEMALLPVPVRKYIHSCGWLGQPKETYAEVMWENSRIKLKPEGKWMKLRTRQYNFIDPPARLAYMRAHMLGIIPFEGRDRYAKGQGHMLGVLGRMVRVFDEKNKETTEGAAMVLLAEALMVPGYTRSKFIHWEEVDDHTARARFVQDGIDVGGVFHFNDEGEYVLFTSDERPYHHPEGGFQRVPFSVAILNYQKQGAIRIVRDVAATWHLPAGDYTYWEGTIGEIRFK